MLPRNGVDLVRRVITRFGLDAGQYVTIIPNSGSHTHLPIDEPAPLLGVLGSCVELQDVAGRDDIAILARHTDDPAQQAALEALAGDDEGPARYRDQVLRAEPVAARPAGGRSRPARCRSRSTSTCCRRCARATTPSPPRRWPARTPAASPSACCAARPAPAPARSPGSARATWRRLPENGTVFVFVRAPSIAFRPPENPHTPMIMIGAGTGLAPFRGFLQERAALQDQGVPVGPSLLFFGCRNAEVDLLYADELRGYERPRPRARRERLLPRHRRRVPLRAGRHARLRGRGVGPAAPGRRGLRVRQRLHDRAGRPERPDPHLPGQDRAGEADAQAWLAGLRPTDRFVEDIWGG